MCTIKQFFSIIYSKLVKTNIVIKRIIRIIIINIWLIDSQVTTKKVIEINLGPNVIKYYMTVM